MPGIAGIIRKQAYDGIESDLQAMVKSMAHETYYVGGQHLNKDLGLYLAWTSHPSDFARSMPLVSFDGRHVLVIAGEEFSHSNGRALLQLYEETGERFLERLNGWFCGVAIDRNVGKVTLFNDRYGMSRVHVYEGKEEFLFASEAKALLRVRPELRKIDPAVLAQYFRYNCVMGDLSFFKGISLLPAGSSWTFTADAIPRKRNYFDYTKWEKRPALKPEEFYEKFEQCISKIAPKYAEGTKPVALSLTAGLDTRVILASVASQRRPLPCYTFGGNWGETFDVRAARKLAEISGQTHEVIRIDESFLQQFPSYAQKSVYISDGTHDVLGAHDVFFNEVAHHIAPIRLTGKFGSEIVRTRKLIPTFNFPRNLFQRSFVPYLDNVPSFGQISKKTHPLTRVVSEEIPWYEYGRVSVEQSKVILRTPYMDNELVELMYEAPSELRASRDLQVSYVEGKSQKLADVPTNMGGLRKDGQPAAKVAYSLYWALFKVEYIYLYATPHWLTRVDRKLERLRPETMIAGRQKFEGYRIWMKTHFAAFIRDALLSSGAQCTEFFDKKAVERMVNGHVAGTHNYLNELNKILTIELIYKSLCNAS